MPGQLHDVGTEFCDICLLAFSSSARLRGASRRQSPTGGGTLWLNVWCSSTALVMTLARRRTGTGPQRHSPCPNPLTWTNVRPTNTAFLRTSQGCRSPAQSVSGTYPPNRQGREPRATPAGIEPAATRSATRRSPLELRGQGSTLLRHAEGEVGARGRNRTGGALTSPRRTLECVAPGPS